MDNYEVKEFMLKGRHIVAPLGTFKARLKKVAKAIRNWERKRNPVRKVFEMLELITPAHAGPVSQARRMHDPYIIISLDFYHAFDNVPPEGLERTAKLIVRKKKESLKAAGICKPIELLELVTYNGRLPQGYPTSPAMFDWFMKSHDPKLSYLVSKLVGHSQTAYRYARYVDNMYYRLELTRPISYYKGLTERIIYRVQELTQLPINRKKTRLIYSGHERPILGLTVRGKLSYKRKKFLKRKLHSLVQSGQTQRANGLANYLREFS